MMGASIAEPRSDDGRGKGRRGLTLMQRFPTACQQPIFPQQWRALRSHASPLPMVGNGATRSAERVRRSNGAAGDDDAAATWRRITRAVRQLANNTPPLIRASATILGAGHRAQARIF